MSGDLKVATFGDLTSCLHVTGSSRLNVSNSTDAKLLIGRSATIAVIAGSVLTVKKAMTLHGWLEVDNSSDVRIGAALVLRQQDVSVRSLDVTVTGKLTIFEEEAGTAMVLDARKILFNGPFTAGLLSLGDAPPDRFVVGVNADVTFKPDSHDLQLAAKTYVRGRLTLRRTISFRRPLCVVFTIDNGGRLTMIGGEDIVVECKLVKINGVFTPRGAVSVGVGLDRLEVGLLGELVVTVSGRLSVQYMLVSGMMIVRGPVTVVGLSGSSTQLMVRESGNLTLDSAGLLSGEASLEASAVSRLIADEVEVAGIFTAGRLSVLDEDGRGRGWRYLRVTANGTVNFTAHQTLLCQDIEVRGKLTVYGAVSMAAPDARMTLFIGPDGVMRLDAGANGTWSGLSRIQAAKITTEPGSKLIGGQVGTYSKQHNCVLSRW